MQGDPSPYNPTAILIGNGDVVTISKGSFEEGSDCYQSETWIRKRVKNRAKFVLLERLSPLEDLFDIVNDVLVMLKCNCGTIFAMNVSIRGVLWRRWGCRQLEGPTGSIGGTLVEVLETPVLNRVVACRASSAK